MKTFKSFITEKTYKNTNITMHVEGGEEYFWPEINGCDIVDTEGCDRFDTCSTASYQDHHNGGLIIEVIMSGAKIVKGKFVAKYAFEYFLFGDKQKLSLNGSVDVIHKGIITATRNAKPLAKAIDHKAKKAFPDWKVAFDLYGNLEMSKDIASDVSLSVTVWDAFDDGAEISMSVSDYSGYERHDLNDKKVDAHNFDLNQLKSVITKYEKFVTKKFVRKK